MKTTLSFIVFLLFPLFINAKPKNNTLYLPLVHNGANFYDNKVAAPPLLSPRSHRGRVFMAQIYFGVPPVSQLLQLDTGSSLTWIQCFPCSRCFDQIYPKYQPQDSITYRDAICETETDPEAAPYVSYSPLTRKCNYTQSYLDNSAIGGILAQETIAVDTLDGEFQRVHGVYFGCNDRSSGTSFSGTGILGLEVGNYSLIGRFGSKFSFCLGQISERKSSHNLILGDGANLHGHPTVINITEDGYIFQLESIIVGEQINLDDPIQVYVDTGSELSHVSSDLYYTFVDALEELIGRPASYEPSLCYKEDAIERLGNIDIGFVFVGGAELSVNAQSIFLPHSTFVEKGIPGISCLAIKNNKKSFPHIIIGVIAMQGYNLGYDLKAKTVYFRKQNCNL